jgi:hypothetical protein
MPARVMPGAGRSATGCRRTSAAKPRPRPSEDDVATMADDLRADLDQLFPQAPQRPRLRGLRHGQGPHESAPPSSTWLKVERPLREGAVATQIAALAHWVARQPRAGPPVIPSGHGPRGVPGPAAEAPGPLPDHPLDERGRPLLARAAMHSLGRAAFKSETAVIVGRRQHHRQRRAAPGGAIVREMSLIRPERTGRTTAVLSLSVGHVGADCVGAG